MKRKSQWIALAATVLLALLLSACGPESTAPPKVEPVNVEEIPGSELKRVVLTEKAAERLGIQTVAVSERQVVQKQTVVGEVVAERAGAAAKANQLWVSTPINESDLKLVARDQPAVILPVTGAVNQDSDKEESGWTVELDEGQGLDDREDEDEDDANGIRGAALYYAVDSAETGLVPGQRVFVEVALSGNGADQKVVPYAAVLYDVEGGTWVYVKDPDALAFTRESITVDYIEGDLAFLLAGPPSGAEVVTVGGSELYGAETGVSK